MSLNSVISGIAGSEKLLWSGHESVARAIVCATWCALAVLFCFAKGQPAGGIIGMLAGCMAVAFYRSAIWARFLTRAIAVFLIVFGPFIVLNPYLYGDVTHSQWLAGKPQSSVAEFFMYFVFYEIVLFVGVYLIDKSDDGVRRKFI